MRTKTTRNYSSALDDIVSAANINVDDNKSEIEKLKHKLTNVYYLIAALAALDIILFFH